MRCSCGANAVCPLLTAPPAEPLDWAEMRAKGCQLSATEHIARIAEQAGIADRARWAREDAATRRHRRSQLVGLLLTFAAVVFSALSIYLAVT